MFKQTRELIDQLSDRSPELRCTTIEELSLLPLDDSDRRKIAEVMVDPGASGGLEDYHPRVQDVAAFAAGNFFTAIDGDLIRSAAEIATRWSLSPDLDHHNNAVVLMMGLPLDDEKYAQIFKTAIEQPCLALLICCRAMAGRYPAVIDEHYITLIDRLDDPRIAFITAELLAEITLRNPKLQEKTVDALLDARIHHNERFIIHSIDGALDMLGIGGIDDDFDPDRDQEYKKALGDLFPERFLPLLDQGGITSVVASERFIDMSCGQRFWTLVRLIHMTHDPDVRDSIVEAIEDSLYEADPDDLYSALTELEALGSLGTPLLSVLESYVDNRFSETGGKPLVWDDTELKALRCKIQRVMAIISESYIAERS